MQIRTRKKILLRKTIFLDTFSFWFVFFTFITLAIKGKDSTQVASLSAKDNPQNFSDKYCPCKFQPLLFSRQFAWSFLLLFFFYFHCWVSIACCLKHNSWETRTEQAGANNLQSLFYLWSYFVTMLLWQRWLISNYWKGLITFRYVLKWLNHHLWNC